VNISDVKKINDGFKKSFMRKERVEMYRFWAYVWETTGNFIPQIRKSSNISSNMFHNGISLPSRVMKRTAGHPTAATGLVK